MSLKQPVACRLQMVLSTLYHDPSLVFFFRGVKPLDPDFGAEDLWFGSPWGQVNQVTKNTVLFFPPLLCSKLPDHSGPFFLSVLST